MDYYNNNNFNGNQYNSNNYNQNSNPYGNNQYPVQNKASGFDIASLVCGILSIVSCCTGIGCFIFGSLGILFAVLNRKKNVPMHALSITGFALGIIGLLLGIFLIVYGFILIFTDPYFYDYINELYLEMYGMDFETFWNNYM